MKNILNIFFKQRILVYGLGISGLSAYNFLKKNNDVFLYDDFLKNIKTHKIKKHIINRKNISKIKFDKIILSPGIDVNKCKLSKFLKKNSYKIYSDLDVFYSYYKNNCITITGTNGKSTTCKLLYDVLLDQKFDVRLVGNIGNPILSAKNIKKKTVFVVEASSYQLEYSRLFKSKYSVILNLSPDHIERHKTLNKYIKAKFKLIKMQSKNNFAFVKKNDHLILKELKLNRIKSKIIKVDTKIANLFLEKINNDYFLTETNKENLSFVLAISKKFKLKKNLLKNSIQNFEGLKYRQQIILKRKNLIIINDSKSTSFSSSVDLLKKYSNVYWILGGIHKKKDKFNLPKKYFSNIRAFIYGRDRDFFIKQLKNKIQYESSYDLKNATKEAFKLIKKKKFNHKIILFSPCAASFDSFKNFEQRGFYFNKLVKRYCNGI